MVGEELPSRSRGVLEGDEMMGWLIKILGLFLAFGLGFVILLFVGIVKIL